MRDKTVAAIIAFFLGGLGIHQFYLGNKSKGILYLVFFWTIIPSIIGFFDGIILLSMSYAEFDRKYNSDFIPVNSYVPTPKTDVAEQIDKLYSLKMRGVITDEEYQVQKRRMMA